MSKGSLRDEQRALTRRRLLDAAEAVFGRRGFYGASVEEIARQAGATTGALYSNFDSKEDLFLALFDERIATDVRDYSQIVASSASLVESACDVADHWMGILAERPYYFPLLVEFWAHALREPRLKSRLANRFAALREAAARLLSQGSSQVGISLSDETAERLALIITALGNGLALEKLIDPDAIPDSLHSELLALILSGLAALARENGLSADGATLGAGEVVPRDD